LFFKARVFIDRYRDIPYVKAVGVDAIECHFLFLLDGFLEAPNILATINFDRKYAIIRNFAENPTIQQEQGRRSTGYCK
jgi:hypothetical protein